MIPVFKSMKVTLKLELSGAEYTTYIVCDNEQNLFCAGVGSELFSEEEAKRIADKCNELVDTEGIISYEKIQKIAEEVHHEYIFNPLSFAGLGEFNPFNLF